MRTFIAGNGQFFLNLAMVFAKLALDCAAGVEGSPLLTAIARNGVEVGIRVSGTGDAWFTGPAAAPAPDAPLTETEQALAAIWREVLGVDAVRAGDDFFALGGHSLRATQVLSRIQERLGVTLPVKALFAAPTLAGRVLTAEAAAA